MLALVAGLSIVLGTNDLIVVAHRGVVNDTLTENSLPSLEETIRRGYTHTEVDVQCTKDGQAVCLHDSNLRRAAGVRRHVGEVTLAELRELTSEETVPSFAMFCKRCAGRIGLMPDVKACPPELKDAFGASIESSLNEYGLMKGALFIGRAEIVKRFEGKAKLAWSVPFVIAKKSERARANPGESYFLFRHAGDLNEEEVEGFHSLGVKVIVSINTFHYRKGDRIQQGLDDVRKMLALGVDGLQIDSVYDRAVFGSAE